VKDEVKLAVKAEAKQAVKDEAKLAVKAEAKQAVKDEVKLAVKDEVKLAVKDEVKLAVKDEVKLAVKDEVKLAVKDEVKLAVKDEVKLAVKAEAKQAVKAEAKQAVKDEAKQAAQRLGSEFTETVADELVSNENFVSRIAEAVSKKMQTHPSKEVLPNSRNIEQRLLVLAREIETLKREYDTLPRNYLLKTGQWNDLTSLGMKVKIDRKIGEDISEFSVQKNGKELCKKLAVQLGQPFFCDIETYRYRIELTYFVNRFLVNDYVGMEIVLVPSD
jgi:hypothetical protein